MDKMKFVHNQIVFLPIYSSMTDSDINDVIDSIEKVSEVCQYETKVYC